MNEGLRCSSDNSEVVYDDQGIPWIVNQILNLTQHVASAEQVAVGVVEPTNKVEVQELLTFHYIPDVVELQYRARALTKIAMSGGYKRVMIGGAPYLMADLESALRGDEITALYSFSERVSIEETSLPDGSVRKINVFRHVGFVGG